MLFIPDKITIFPPPLSFSSFFTISFIFYELTKPVNLFLAFIQSISLSLSLFSFLRYEYFTVASEPRKILIQLYSIEWTVGPFWC